VPVWRHCPSGPLAATDKARKVAVTVFDEDGKQLAGALTSQDTERPQAAAGVAPIAGTVAEQRFSSTVLLAVEPLRACSHLP